MIRGNPNEGVDYGKNHQKQLSQKKSENMMEYWGYGSIFGLD